MTTIQAKPCPQGATSPPRFIIALLVLAVGVLAQGCMLVPYDEQEVKNRFSEIEFSGYVPWPDQRVILHARNPNTGLFEEVKPLVPSSSDGIGPLEIDGVMLYPWTIKRTLPKQYWKWDSGRGAFLARVKATTPTSWSTGHNLLSVEYDWYDCFQDKGRTPTDFMRYCSAENSPEARIYTYADSPASSR